MKLGPWRNKERQVPTSKKYVTPAEVERRAAALKRASLPPPLEYEQDVTSYRELNRRLHEEEV